MGRGGRGDGGDGGTGGAVATYNTNSRPYTHIIDLSCERGGTDRCVHHGSRYTTSREGRCHVFSIIVARGAK